MARAEFILLPTAAHRLSYFNLSGLQSIAVEHCQKGQLIEYEPGSLYGIDRGSSARFGYVCKFREPVTTPVLQRTRELIAGWGLPVDSSLYTNVLNPDHTALAVGYQYLSGGLTPDQVDQYGLRTISLGHALGFPLRYVEQLPPIASVGVDGVKYRILRRLALYFGT